MSVLKPYEIPLSPNAQKFSIDLLNVTYNMRLAWNAVAACWILDIADQNNVALLNGVPLITGANLAEQFHYLGFGGGFLVVTDTDADAVPTYSNLGTTAHLYFFAVLPDGTAI